MCFPIAQGGRTSHTTAWKLVQGDEYHPAIKLQSRIYPKSGRNWARPGGIARRSQGPTYKASDLSAHNQTEHGIYVFLKQTDVKEEYWEGQGWGSDVVILELEVRPEDQLHLSLNGNRATYEKVRIKEKQTYITWVD